MTKKEKQAIASMKYKLAHPKRIKKRAREYYWANLEKERNRYRVSNKKRRLEHPEQIKAMKQEYEETHKEQKREQRKRFYLAHPGYEKEYQEQYKKSGRRKVANEKSRAKRRYLGFIPLNDYFEGAEAHHINKEQVIYIPKVLHRSIPHDIFRNRSMQEINITAIAFLNPKKVSYPVLSESVGSQVISEAEGKDGKNG